MKRLFVISEEGRGGGALRRIKLMTQELQEHLVMTVVIPRSAQSYQKELKRAGLSYKTINFHPLSKKSLSLAKYVLFFIPELVALCNLIKSTRPDLLHCNGSWQVKGIIAAYLCGVKSLWHMNDAYQPLMVRLLFKIISPFCDSFIFASERTLQYYRSINPNILLKPHWTIQAPVDTSFFTPGPMKDLFSHDAFNVVTVGYVNNNKGLEYLIEAAAILRDILPNDVHFYIVGEVLDSQREYYKKLKQKIAKLGVDNVTFLGPRTDVREILNASNCYVCSSIQESSPIAVWEALSCGQLVVSTDVGDVAQIFESYDCGFIIPPKDAASIAEALKKIFLEYDSLLQKRDKARQAALENFSSEKIKEKYLNIYCSL